MTTPSPVTITGACPACGYARKLCQAKAGPLLLGCSRFPWCTFRCAYDPVLQQLRDHNARLQAELTLLHMQRTAPRPEEHTQGRRTGAQGVQERRRAMATWADVAHTWSATLRERRGVQP
jgi:ssDNA-binding Zn-finger/Zn-ribbon topoisomerase 1